EVRNPNQIRMTKPEDDLNSRFSIRVSEFGFQQLSLDNREYVILRHDDELFAIQLDLGAGVAGEDDFIALLDGEGGALAGVEALAIADAEDFAALGLFLSGVGKNDAGFGLGLGLDALHKNLVAERTQFGHDYSSLKR